jgi:tetratricopeptide (TPR) repeat protein
MLLAVLLPAEKAIAREERAEAYYHFSLGLQARFSGETESALTEYRRAQKLDPASSEIRIEIARLLRETGRFDEAIREAQAAVSMDPENADAHSALGQLYLLRAETGDPTEALRKAAAEMEAAVRLEPNDGGTLLQLAALYGRLQDHKESARVWQQYAALDPASFDAQLQLGTQYLALGDSAKAAAALQRALEIEPSSARAYQRLGEAYANADQMDQAILHFRKALELEPTDIRTRLGLGEILFRAHRNQEALAEANAVLAADAKNRYALDLQGRALRELKDYDGAARAADTVLALSPGDLKASYLKVTIAEGRRDFATAASLLEQILQRSRRGEDEEETGANDRVFLIHLGFAYQQLERYANAADAFGRAAKVGGDVDATLLGYRVEALVLAKDYDKALTESRAARSRFPDDPDLAAQEATALRFKGDEAGALKIIDELRQKAPADLNVLLQVAEFYQRAKRYDDAESALRKARSIEPKNLRVLFQLGAVIERQKREDEAETVFREALALQPDSAPVLNYLGYMNADRGVRLEEALGFVEKAVQLDPENGAYLDSLGWANYRLNRLERAEELLRKAVTKPGSNAVVFDHLADTLKRRGNVAEALDYWRKALAAEDEDGELDRAGVDKKVREAQSALDAQKR